MATAEGWIVNTPYCNALGIDDVAFADGRCQLRLPFREANANPTGILHGGVAASLSVMAGQAVAYTTLGVDSGPWYTADIQINYLAAATGETLSADATLAQKGRDLCFSAVEIRNGDGRKIAQSLLLVRARHGDNQVVSRPHGSLTLARHGEAPMAERIRKNPFIASRGMEMALQEGGNCLITMPSAEGNKSAEGAIHEGAILALLDTAGAMACFPLVGRPAKRAVTPSIQAQFLGLPPAEDLEARAKVIHREGELFWTDVEVGALDKSDVVARGTVVYRIVPEN